MGVGTMIVQSPTVTYTNGTKIYGGTLEIDGTATAGTGALNAIGGNFAQSSGTTNVAPTTIFSVATNSILINAANGLALDNSNLTFSTGSHLEMVYSNTISPSATTPALIVTNISNGLTASNSIAIDILCGSISLGQFPLIKYSGTIGGDGGNAFVLGVLEPHAQGYISNNVANSSIDLVVTNITQPITWAAGTGLWDIASTANFNDTLSNPTTYQQNIAGGDNVIFNDSPSGAGPFTVTLNANPSPSSVTFNNTKTYTLSGIGSVDGIGSVTKSGSGTLFLQTTNFFKGGININGGLVNFMTLSNLGAGPISFGSGTLQYASGTLDDISVDTVTFNAGGATIDVNGNAVVYNHPVGNGGAGGLTVTGGTLQVSGTNRYSGNTFINSGSTLQFPNLNTYVSNSAALVVNGTLDASLQVNANGFGLVLSGPASQELVGTGTVKGEISTSGGTTISPATNGTFGTLTVIGDLTVNGGTIAMDIAGPTGASKDTLAITNGVGSGGLTLNGGLNSGTLQLNVTGTLNNGVYPLISYFGPLSGDVGNLVLSGFSQAGSLGYLSSSATANGTINLNVISGATNSLTWNGLVNNIWDSASTANWTSNGVTGQIFQNGDNVTLDDSGLNPAISLGDTGVAGSGTLLPGSVVINATNNNYTFQDGVGDGSGQWLGSMSLTINSSANNVTTILTPNGNNGLTTINGGTLQVGNGSVTGTIGVGNITNNGTLVFDQTDNRSVPGQISGTGKLVQEGSADLILLGNNSYAGQTVVSNVNSSLQVGAGGAAGTLGTGAVIDNGTLFIDRSGSFTLNNGVTGAGSVILAGGAAFSLSGTLAWQGNTYLTNGSIKLASANQIPNVNSVPGSTGAFGLSGTFDLNGFNQMVNGLTDLGTTNGLITNSAAAGTNVLTIGLNSPSNSLLYSGLIADVTNRSGIQLVVETPGTVQLAHANTYHAGTFVGNGATLNLGTAGSGGIPGNAAAGTGGITLSNGTTLFMNGNSITVVPNAVTFAPASTVSFNSQALGDQYSGQITGDAASTNVIAGPWTSAGAGGYSGFAGTVLIPSGGTLRFFASPGGGTNTTFDIEGTGVLQTRTTEFVNIGKLTGNASFGLDSSSNVIVAGIPASNAGGAGNFVIGAANANSTYRGTISGPNNIYKVGTGTLSLVGSSNFFVETTTATNSFLTNGLAYVGSTSISNGVLQIVAPANLNGTNFTSFTLASNTAVLDLSSAGYTPDGTNLVTNSTLTLVSGQSLTGLGTIRGSLNAGSGSTVSVALPSNTNGLQTTGALNITNSAEFGGAITININATNTPNSGEIVSPSITIDPSATLVVSNLGPQAGATFQLFSHAVSGFASVTLPPLTGTNAWVNNLGVDGSITLEAPALVTGPTTNATITKVLLSGTNLVIVGTNNNTPNTSFHYAVLTATNIATPLTNWTSIATNGFNPDGTFDYTNPIVPGTPRQFIDVKAVP
jgi:autotransporter-associated beta strand protein